MEKSFNGNIVKICTVLGCLLIIVSSNSIGDLIFAGIILGCTFARNKLTNILLILGITFSLFLSFSIYFHLINILRIIMYLSMLIIVISSIAKTEKNNYGKYFKIIYLCSVVIYLIYIVLMIKDIPFTILGDILLIPFFMCFDKLENNAKNRLEKSKVADAKYSINGANGQLYVYDDRIIIDRKGILSFLNHGLSGSKTIPIKTIQSVQFRKAGPMVNGFIQFGVLGGNEGRRGVLNATSDENSLMIYEKDNEIAEKVKQYIEDYIVNKDERTSTIINQVSSADELKKYKDLLDSGIITQEEFDAKKKQLLGL